MDKVIADNGRTLQHVPKKCLLEIVTCVICDNIMHPPVKMCSNHHSVCKSCFLQITKCPMCRSRTMTLINIKVAFAYKMLKLECSNHERGCEFTSNDGNLETHVKICDFQLLECPIKSCPLKWTGVGKELTKHFDEAHGNSTTNANAHNFKDYTIWKINIKNLKGHMESSPNAAFRYASTFSVFGILFKIVMHFRMEKETVYIKRRLQCLVHSDVDTCRKYFFFLKYIDEAGFNLLLCYSFTEVEEKKCFCEGQVGLMPWTVFQKSCTGSDFIFDIYAKQLQF